ncbi:hypothetical protein BGW80DRAFT_1347311 [Lactifluus volemus]|nr:hypothetical protein BGW80DRAFT_1347311 [Lactifluus volemus]
MKLNISSSTPDTRDRPYKCQHCDQFARCVLLWRHINKCHPCEKPRFLNSFTSQRFRVGEQSHHFKVGVRPMGSVQLAMR